MRWKCSASSDCFTYSRNTDCSLLMNKALPGARPGDCASGKEKLVLWNLRKWGLVTGPILSSTCSTYILCCKQNHSKNLVTESNSLISHGFCGSGIQEGLNYRCWLQLQSEWEQWRAGAAEGRSGTFLPSSLRVPPYPSLCVGLGFLTAWQPQGTWSGYMWVAHPHMSTPRDENEHV